MYSIVFAANASSWVDSPALASISCAATVSIVCGRPSATGASPSPAVEGVLVQPDLGAVLDVAEDVGADRVDRPGRRR